MRFGSVCSGIEAASVAWHPLGWRAAWLAEIEPFPSAVLKHHYPEVPNLGDMTALPDRIRSGEVEAPDLFCGGTPCQAFSVAGLRRSLDDARGNLSLTFCEIADAIDSVRRARGEQPAIIFWENVPGVLSTADNAFGCFLGALAGCDTAIEPLAATGWTDAGVVAGPQRTVAWRVLDAQYFGLAQRRRRVFVVASARDAFDPAAVLLEFDGLRRDSAPSREAGQGAAPTIAGCANGGGANGPGRDVDSCESLQVVSMCLNAKGGAGRLDAESETLIPTIGGGFDGPVAMRESGQGYWMQDDIAGTLRAEGEDRPSRPSHVVGVPMINMQGSKGNAVAQADGPSFTLNAMHGHDVHAVLAPTLTATNDPSRSPQSSEVTQQVWAVMQAAQPYTLAIRGRGDSHNLEYRQDGTANALLTPNGGRGGIGVGAVAVPEVAGTMKACKDSGGWSNSADHAAAGYMVPVAFHPTQDPISSTDVSHAIGTGSGRGCATAAVAVQAIPIDTMNHVGRGDNHSFGDFEPGAPSYTLTKGHSHAVATAMQVRRLTPVECERLQGFPDGYTAIPWRGKPASECPDGPRYKALGNSWAVPVVRWIGCRINRFLEGTT